MLINNSYYRSGNEQKTGSLSLIRNFFIRMANENEWFDLGISVRRNHITVTFTDHKGRRMRLWLPDEVVVENEEQFMDMLVSKILEIVSSPVISPER